jgi:hypothetical protein
MDYYELSVTPVLFNALAALENEYKQKIFVVDTFYRETEPGGRGDVLKLWFSDVPLPQGCQREIIEKTLLCFKTQGDWDKQSLFDAFSAYLYWNEHYEMQHVQSKFVTIVISVLLGLSALFVLQPLGLLSFWWIAVIAFPFCTGVIQELTRFYMEPAYRQRVEEALLAQIKLTTATTVFNTAIFEEETTLDEIASSTQPQNRFCDTSSGIAPVNQVSECMITHAEVHVSDSKEIDDLEHSSANDTEHAAAITDYGTMMNRCHI